jgi:hypothetical protein
MQPSREFQGQRRCPHACPLESSTRHPSDSAYCIARSMCLSGCRGLLIQPILEELLTHVKQGVDFRQQNPYADMAGTRTAVYINGPVVTNSTTVGAPEVIPTLFTKIWPHRRSATVSNKPWPALGIALRTCTVRVCLRLSRSRHDVRNKKPLFLQGFCLLLSIVVFACRQYTRQDSNL